MSGSSGDGILMLGYSLEPDIIIFLAKLGTETGLPIAIGLLGFIVLHSLSRMIFKAFIMGVAILTASTSVLEFVRVIDKIFTDSNSLSTNLIFGAANILILIICIFYMLKRSPGHSLASFYDQLSVEEIEFIERYYGAGFNNVPKNIFEKLWKKLKYIITPIEIVVVILWIEVGSSIGAWLAVGMDF